ncbi:MAG: sugar-binding domain-containing protein [Spirochaetota bacterium]
MVLYQKYFGKKTLDLNGRWDLQWADPGQGEAAGIPQTGCQAENRIAASVPGDVHIDLIEAGIIDEPLWGKNAPACAWMEEKDWWYSRTFEIDPGFIGERVELHFEGLDTTADVWLNGQHLGSHNNMHIPYTIEVTEAVREGTNLVVVRLDVGLRAVRGKDTTTYSKMLAEVGPEPARIWIRKAQFTFGWDWAPRLLTCGIWRGVELHSYETVSLRDLCLRTHLLADGMARVKVLLELENFSSNMQAVQITLSLRGRERHEISLKASLQPGLSELCTHLEIPDPDLWWPAPLGEPALYDVAAVVRQEGQILDQKAFCYGLREVALIQELIPNEGKSFIIAVNGQKFYCKGANWVPADSLIARVSPAKYRELVRLAAEANFNMFRIWGGGIFEDDYFYELCDQFGILIWQDFLYACGYYPDDDPEFVAQAQREAELAVRRLRNHPCIALWCGNNENQWIHWDRVQQGAGADRLYGEIIYDQILPEVCARLDPTRPYWPGSPYGGDDPNSPEQGDRHNWHISIGATPEERIDYPYYEGDQGKFISEFGILAPPPLDSLMRFLPPGELDRHSPGWSFHNNQFEQGAIWEALKRYWKSSEELSLSAYIIYSQMIQAEALKFALEHWRRRKFDTSGTLFWMYSDSWGAVGWTIVDYYLRLKPSYYAVRRAFAPLLASFAPENGLFQLWLTNDTLGAREGSLQYGWVDLENSKVESQHQEAIAPAKTSTVVAKLPLPEGWQDQPGRWMAFCRFSTDGQVLSRSRRFLSGFQFNQLPLPKAEFDYQLQGPDDSGVSQLILKANSFVWMVQIQSPRGVWVEDNYFDLIPGETVQIRLSGPAVLMKGLRVTALNEQ